MKEKIKKSEESEVQRRWRLIERNIKMQKILLVLLAVIAILQAVNTIEIIKRNSIEKNTKQKYCSVYVNDGETLESIYGDVLTSYPLTNTKIGYTKWKEEFMKINFMEDEQITPNRFYTIIYIEYNP